MVDTIHRSVSLFIIILFLLTMGMGCGWGHSSLNNYQPVTPDMAYTVACSYLKYLGDTTHTMVNVTKLYDDSGILIGYLFHLLPTGYIAVTGKQCLPPVIAYSLTSSAGGTNNTNLLMQFLKCDISSRLNSQEFSSPSARTEHQQAWQQLCNGDILSCQASYQQWPPPGSTETDGWLETTWSQDAPYNSLCPLDTETGERSIAGCPAIAMGQILNYHQTINGIRFNDSDDYLHNYAGRRYTIDDDYASIGFPSFSNLNMHLADLEDSYQQNQQPTDQELAALIFGCGVAAKQVYTSEESGTFGVNQACQAYDRFGVDYTFMDSENPELYGLLAMNMINGLPVHLAVVNEGWTAGHNLVVDGYNTDYYFHLNFGWGGTYDGWYLLPQEVRFDLTVIEGAIINIMRSPTGSDIYCKGNLHWADIDPGETVTSSFTVTNIGVPSSMLNWSIVAYPEWGTWSFSSTSGTGLGVGNEESIVVNVTAPDRSLRNNTGYVKVVNTDNPNDCCIVQVSLSTPFVHMPFILRLLTALLDQFPLLQSFFATLDS